jgi:hypothetical protein
MSQISKNAGSGGGGTGNVTGPGSSVNNDIVIFNGTTGQLIADSGVPITSVIAPEGFAAYMSASAANVTGDGTTVPLVFNTTMNNTGNYNPANGVYTAPSTGIYLFTTTVALTGGNASSTNYIIIWDGNGYSARAFQDNPVVPSGGNTNIYSACIVIPMNAGDGMKVSANVSGAAKNITVFGGAPSSLAVTSTFAGRKISN